MVGVPGRSKGCMTCRKRKKGCDLERPACAQCRKQGLACAGYDTPLVFVVSNQSIRRPGYRVSRNSSQETSSFLWQKAPGVQHHDQLSNSTSNLRLLARPEDERRCIDLFWEAYFPSGRPIPATMSRSYTCTWTETARNLYRDDDSLRYALGANCLVMTGTRDGATWMLQEGSRLYGKALLSLRRTLSLSKGAMSNTCIATTKLLSIFEAFTEHKDAKTTPSHSPDWQRHISGELALFVARTPAGNVNGEAHYIFADERVEMALKAILQHKELVLGNSEWKSIPWLQIPKDLKDLLVDVLVDMPSLVQHFDEMCLCTDSSRQAHVRAELILKCREHDRQLQAWSNVVLQLPNTNQSVEPCTKPPATATTTGSQPNDLVTHIAIVHGMSLFWTTSLVLYSILRKALESETTKDLPERTSPLYCAHKLIETLTILLQPQAGLYGQRSAALPLEVAMQYIGMSSGSGTLSSEVVALLETVKRLKHSLGRGTVSP